MAVSSTVVVLLPQQARPVDDPPPVAQPVLPLPQQAVLASPNIVVLPIAIRAAAAPLTAKAEATPARQATPAVAAPPHAATPPVATPAWQAELLRCLARARRYPPAARLGREEGIAYVEFTLDRSGHVLRARLATGSGFASLDAEAVALIYRADPLPPPPGSAPEVVTVKLPIVFRLN